MAYVDTSVILAKYFPSDELHKEASSYLARTTRKKIISPVSALELAAVLSRLQSELRAPKDLVEAPSQKRVRAILEFFIKDSNLFLAAIQAHAKIKIAGAVLSVPLEYASCIHRAHALKLKTLDLIHLIYALNLRLSGYELDTFVTGDHTILKNSEAVEHYLEISVKEPGKAP